MKHIIGIDLGTSGVKCVVVAMDGTVKSSVTEEYPCFSPNKGWSEQNPEDWWVATQKAINKAVNSSGFKKTDIVGVGLSGQMHGLVALDFEDTVIRPAILWNDQRSTRECDEIISAAGGLNCLLSFTNNSMLTGYTASKLLWMRKNEPENYNRMRTFLMPKDYIRLRITGVKGTDVSDASGTGLFDVRNRVWSDSLISRLKFSRSLFPVVYESDEVTGYVQQEAGINIPVGTPVYAGGGDAVIQNVGMGIVEEGVVGVVIGTSGVVSMAVNGFAPNEGGVLQFFCGNHRSKWCAFGCQLSSGGALDWFQNTFYPDLSFRQMDEWADASAPGAQGLVFLPYLTGERCPYANPSAKAVFYGATVRHTRGDFVRAVMEGVSFGLKDVYRLIVDATPELKPQYIIMAGGGSKSELWRKILADIFGLPVVTCTGAAEGASYGAALVAGVGAGLWEDLKQATSAIKVEDKMYPNLENSKVYEESYAVYRKLYQDMKDSFSNN